MSELRTTSLSHKDNTTGTPNITMYADGTTSLPGTALGGFRNALVNGDFGVNQRGGGPFSAGTAYTSDRWKVNNGSLVTVASGGAYGTNKLSINGAAVCQAVELTPNPGRAGVFPVGSQWTFSIWATAQPTDFTAGFVDVALDGTNVVTVVSSTAMTSTTETNNGFTKYTITFTVNASPVSTNVGFQVALNNYTGDVSLAQLEPGPVATPFEHRPIGTELALCQRYFESSIADQYGYNGNGGNVTYFDQYNYMTAKRIVPTVNRTVTGSVNVTNASVININLTALLVFAQVAATGSYSVSTVITLDAEL